MLTLRSVCHRGHKVNFGWVLPSPVVQHQGSSWPWFAGPHSEWIWVLCQFVVVLFSAIFIFWQVRSQRLTNMIEALRDIDKKWSSPELLKAREIVCVSFVKNSGYSNVDEFSEIDHLVLGFFEDLGLFFRFKAVSKKVVWESYSYVVECYWFIFKSAILRYRANTDDGSWYTQFEQLYGKCRKKSIKKKSAAPESVDALLGFAGREIGWVKALESLKGSLGTR